MVEALTFTIPQWVKVNYYTDKLEMSLTFHRGAVVTSCNLALYVDSPGQKIFSLTYTDTDFSYTCDCTASFGYSKV